MLALFEDCYILPHHPTKVRAHSKSQLVSTQDNMSDIPYDELFIWSLLLCTGDENDLMLTKFYWSQTKHPIACALTAIVIYKRISKLSCITEHLKKSLIGMKR